MDTRKRLTKILLFAFLVLFPFGQLISLNLGRGIRIQPIDLIVVTSIFLLRFKYIKLRWFQTIFFPLIFSFLFSISIFRLFELQMGLLYLVRLLGYVCFFINIKNSVEESDIKILLYSLLSVSLITAVFGWIQYLYLPDLRTLKFFGWDDHLYRLIGTFLDPAFIGIILVLGSLVSLSLFYIEKKKYFIYIFGFIAISLAFTYSRSSYLAFLVGVFLISIMQKKFKYFVMILAIFVIGITFLPRPSSEGVKLERTKSILARLENYNEAVSLIKVSPIFGVGFDNICSAKLDYLQDDNINSHSCSGLDSSLFYVFITTGLIGSLIFMGLFINLVTKLNFNFWSHQLLIVSLVVLLIHSQFSNSLFYPWVMGWFAILGGITLRGKFNS